MSTAASNEKNINLTENNKTVDNAVEYKTEYDIAIEKYGETKIRSFRNECETLHNGMKYDSIKIRPEQPTTSSDYSAWVVFVKTPYESNYGTSTEVVITVARSLRNRFNEEYKETADCKFSGPPLWTMVKDSLIIIDNKIETPKIAPFLIEAPKLKTQEIFSCETDSDCSPGFSCRSKSGGGMICKEIQN